MPGFKALRVRKMICAREITVRMRITRSHKRESSALAYAMAEGIYYRLEISLTLVRMDLWILKSHAFYLHVCSCHR